jgi:hypothetical protein
MDPHAELEQLLAGLFDGPPEAARNRRLGALLHDHPELQGEYLDYLQLHALLQWRAGVGSKGEEPPSSIRAASRPRRRLTRARLVAAAVFLMASLGVLLLFRSPEARAAPDVVERLIDWNLDLSRTRSRDERSRLYSGQVADLKATLAKAELPPEDRALAQTLLENSSWLAEHDDPVAEADRFNDIADQLVTRMDAATAANDEGRVVKLADSYRRLTEQGVDANLERALASGALSGERKQKLERAQRRGAHRAQRVAEILERNPEASRKALHRPTKGRPHKSKKSF